MVQGEAERVRGWEEERKCRQPLELQERLSAVGGSWALRLFCELLLKAKQRGEERIAKLKERWGGI